MEENTTTNTTTSTSNGGNTMMFVIGAIVLAGILGYVIFSSSDNETMDTDSRDQDDSALEQPTPEPEPEPVQEVTTMEEQPTEDLSAAENMKLNLDANAVSGDSIDTKSTSTDVKVFEVEAGFPYFKPNLITVKKGDTVRIVMKSVDMMHDFNIDELGIKIPVTNSGDTNTVEFVADEAGSYEYYCSVGQHRQNGQFGTLVVQE